MPSCLALWASFVQNRCHQELCVAWRKQRTNLSSQKTDTYYNSFKSRRNRPFSTNQWIYEAISLFIDGYSAVGVLEEIKMRWVWSKKSHAPALRKIPLSYRCWTFLLNYSQKREEMVVFSNRPRKDLFFKKSLPNQIFSHILALFPCN